MDFKDNGPLNGMDPEHCGKPPQTKYPIDRSFMLKGYPPSLIKKHGKYATVAFERLKYVALGDAMHNKGKDPAEPFPNV